MDAAFCVSRAETLLGYVAAASVSREVFQGEAERFRAAISARGRDGNVAGEGKYGHGTAARVHLRGVGRRDAHDVRTPEEHGGVFEHCRDTAHPDAHPVFHAGERGVDGLGLALLGGSGVAHAGEEREGTEDGGKKTKTHGVSPGWNERELVPVSYTIY